MSNLVVARVDGVLSTSEDFGCETNGDLYGGPVLPSEKMEQVSPFLLEIRLG